MESSFPDCNLRLVEGNQQYIEIVPRSHTPTFQRTHAYKDVELNNATKKAFFIVVITSPLCNHTV